METQGFLLQDSNVVSIQPTPRSKRGQAFLIQTQRRLKCFAGVGKLIKQLVSSSTALGYVAGNK